MRNVLIAAGNAGQPELIALIEPILVAMLGFRAMAIWALSCISIKIASGG